MKNDTIASIATPPGEGGIAIIRVAGPQALKIADAVFRCRSPKPSKRPANSFVYGHVVNPQGDDIDEAILLIYRAPHSYTREDTVEIQGHGGSVCAGRILQTVLDAGARQAQPGEFTRRAFLSGRIDLLQAEAVMDLIKSRSERAASVALEQLEGSLSDSISDTYDDLLDIAANLEATLDFDEDDLPDTTFIKLHEQLKSPHNSLLQLLDNWNEGHLLREGATVVLAGKPNAGKSTLMNALLGKPRAIVTHLAGTTRDTIEEQIILQGIPIRLTDTAGIRETDCNIEQESIRRAKEKVKISDLIIWVIDGSDELSRRELDDVNTLDHRKLIVVINKSDLGLKVSQDQFDGLDTVICGMNNPEGISNLRKVIVDKLNISPATQHHAVISERHRRIISEVVSQLDEVAAILEQADQSRIILAAGSLRSALEQLGEITGRNYHDGLLDTIFGKFCIGK